MSYKIVTLALVALHALTSTALPPCVCTRNLTPVCGSDGKTYGNQCILDCEKSKTGRDITTAKTGPCEAVTTCFCTYEYKPVCGTDGNTYPNRCSLGCERSALPDLDVVSEGACEDRVTQPPCICTDDLRYVCGTDGNTYDNACMLNCQTAKDPTLAVKSQGKCVDKVRVVEPVITKREVPVPPCICTAELNEVCGSDGVSYGNPCMLNCATANNPSLSIKSQGRCDNVQVANPIVNDQSKCVCPRNLKPVCGSDGVTYGNECLLKCAGAQVSLARSGSC